MKIKNNLISLNPYRVEETFAGIRLDANETNNFIFPDGIAINDISFHRYPDHQAILLRKALSEYLGVEKKYLVEGNGSSELIELIIKTYVEKDGTIMSFEPTFSMYGIYATIYGANYKTFPLNDDYTLDVAAFIQHIQWMKPSVVFLCTPNNPTGRQLKKEEIINVIRSTKALVVIDEAYIEFADMNESLTKDIIKYDNTCVLRTFSKAFGLASIRLGYMIANEKIIDDINRVKSPYHVNQVSQFIGTLALSHRDKVNTMVQQIITSRDELYQALLSLPLIVYPSQGNFLFIQSPKVDIYPPLLAKGIRIRAYKIPFQSYRITIGTNEENVALLRALKEIFI